MAKDVCEILRKKYKKCQVISRCRILGEDVPIARDEAMLIFGCREWYGKRGRRRRRR